MADKKAPMKKKAVSKGQAMKVASFMKKQGNGTPNAAAPAAPAAGAPGAGASGNDYDGDEE